MDPDSRNFQSSEDQGGPQPPAHRDHSSASTSRATVSHDESHLDDWEDGSCLSFPEWDPYDTTEASAQEAEPRYDASYRGSTVYTTALFQEQAAAPIVEAREMGEEDSPVVPPSFFDTFFEGLSHEYAENDKEKRVPDGGSSDTTESAGQNDESYYDAIFRRSTVGKTVLLLEEAAARIAEGRGTAEGTSISSKATASTTTSSLRDTSSEGQSDEYDVKQTEKGHARARRSTWPRPIPSGLDYDEESSSDEEISTVPQWAKEMMGLTDQEDTSKSVPDSKPNGASKEAAPLSAPSAECSYRSVIVRAPSALEQQQSSERKEQAELWWAGVRQPPPRSQLASTMCLLTLPVPNTPKPMYTAVSVCNSSCTLHEGGSEKCPATIGSTHQQSSCTREEQAGLRWDGVRQPPPRSHSTPTLNLLRPPVPTAQNPLYNAVSWSAPSQCLLQRPVPIVPQPVYTRVSMSNTRHTLHEGGSEKHAATFGSIHQQSSCTGGEQAELRPAGVRKPLPPSQLALSLPEQLGPLPIPPKPKAVYTVASLCNSSSTSQDGGSEGGAATIGSTHQQGSCTREEQSGLWQAGVRQPPPLASLGPSLHMLPVPVRSASKVVYTAEALCKSSGTSHEDASEKHAATIVPPHQQSSCTGEEQAGLWPAGVRQSLPPSQLAVSLPEQLGPLPIPPKAMYTAASLCSSSRSSTQYEGGSAEGAATIGSTHQQGSSTGEEQAGLWQAGVRQPAPLAPLGPSRHMLPMPVPTASKVTYTAASLCCSSSTAHEDGSEKCAATILSRHQPSSCTGEEQAGLWPAGVRQSLPPSQLAVSLPEQLGPLPIPPKAMYTAASLCSSSRSSTQYEGGSAEGAATIGSTHQQGSSTGEEQAGLWQAGVRQPAPLAPLGPSRHMLPMPVPTASKVTYTAASLCCSSSTAHEDGSEKCAATILSRHQPSSCTGEEQAGLWPAGVRQSLPPSQLAPSLPPQRGPLPIPLKSMYTVESLCSSRTSYEGGSAEGAATFGSTHEHGSCTGFPQHGAMGGIMLTSRERACPMTASSIHMTPSSKPSIEYKTKQRREEILECRATGAVMSTFCGTPDIRPSTEYAEKQMGGGIPVWRPYDAAEVADTEGPLDLTTHNRKKATKTVPTIDQPQYPAKYSGHGGTGVIMSPVARAAPVAADSTSCETTSQSPLIKRTKKQMGERFSEDGETGVTVSAMAETASVPTFHDATPGRAPTEYTKKQTEGEDKQADASSAQQPLPLPALGILGRSEEELLPWPLVTPQDVEYYIGLPLYASTNSSLGVATSIHADADTSEESPSRRG